MKHRKWMIVTLWVVLALAACTATPVPETVVQPTATATVVVPTETEEAPATATATETVESIQLPTAKLVPNPTFEEPLNWSIIFVGAPCEKVGESCQPHVDTTFGTYLIEASGTGFKEANLPVTSSLIPQASSTGRYLAYYDRNHLYLFDYQNDQSTQLLNGWPSVDFAQNEEFLVYGASRLTNNEPAEVRIGLIKLDDLTHTTLITLPLRGAELYLSPDDTQVLIKGQAPDRSTESIYILNLINDQIRQVFQAKRIGPIHWTPSGSEIELVRLDTKDEDYISTLFRLKPGEEHVRPIFKLELPHWIRHGFWSPDGEEFIFVLQPRRSEEEGGIYVLEVEKLSFSQILSQHYITDLNIWPNETP